MSFDCDGPGIGTLMIAFDAAFEPIEKYLLAVTSPDELSAVELSTALGELTVPGALPMLQGIAFAEVAIAAADLPAMPAYKVLPAVGFDMPPWKPEIQGIALATTLVKMVNIPLNLIIKLAKGDSFEYPDIITELLPDVPGVEGLTQCVQERLDPIFGG